MTKKNTHFKEKIIFLCLAACYSDLFFKFADKSTGTVTTGTVTTGTLTGTGTVTTGTVTTRTLTGTGTVTTGTLTGTGTI